MASYTEHLKLLKKDPVQDGSDTFNIQTMLNENWDKIDKAVGEAESAEDSIKESAEKTAALADGDAFAILDSADGTKLKRVLWSAVKAALSSLFAAKNHSHTLSSLGAAPSSHNHDASQINSGTLPVARGGTGQTTLTPAVATKGVRQIYAGTTDMTAGSSSLTTGCIYLVYE